MRILEARDSFIRLESEKEVSVSSFIQISSAEKQYIAQVIKVQKLGEIFLTFAKILFLFDGEIKKYDNSLPEKDAVVSEFKFDKLSALFNIKKPLHVGKNINDYSEIFVDTDTFSNKTLLCFDNNASTEIITSNLKQELSKISKTFVIDMQGVVPAQKFIAGKDFKLPLNTESLEFMYEDCLNDATSDSKSLIKEIFRDLAEYSKTVSFLPFGTLKAIVDDMVNNSHIFKLLVLKNKLSKFNNMGYFATNTSEAENLEKILRMQSAVLDLSKLDTIFQNRYLEIIYKNIETGAKVILIASNNLNKKNLKNVLVNQNIETIFTTHSKFKYINEIKTMFKNFVIEPSFNGNEIFKIYKTFLNTMQKDTYLIVGEATNFLPLISHLERLPENTNFNDNDEIFDEIVDLEIQTENSFVKELEAEIVKDEQTEAIEKKSEALIEKIAEDKNELPEDRESLFSDEEEDDDNEETIEDSNDITDALETEDTIITNEANDDANYIEAQESIDVTDTEILSEDIESTETVEEVLISNTKEEDEYTEEESFHTEIDEFQTIEVSDEILEMTEDSEEEFNKEAGIINENLPSEDVNEIENVGEIQETIEATFEAEPIVDEDLELEDNIIADSKEESITTQYEEEITEEELDAIPLDNKSEQEDFEVLELDATDANDNDIFVEIDDSEELETESISIDKEIIEDVDKVFTTMKDDTLSENDLDLIDELNNEIPMDNEFEELNVIEDSEEQELDFNEPIEELNDTNSIEDTKEILETKKSGTPNIPVYEAEIPPEDIVISDTLEQGDTVSHAKYGSGVVEKMIKYGNKTLYSINFDNIGRRLLDPTLTELKKG